MDVKIQCNNDITNNAIKFVKKWTDEIKKWTDGTERAEAQTFWNEFFCIFGIDRNTVASFERKVSSKNKNKFQRIDLLWAGKLIVEHKSIGKNLENATIQAKDYIAQLKHDDIPRYIIVSDFKTFKIIDRLTEHKKAIFLQFNLEDLSNQNNLSNINHIFHEEQVESDKKYDELNLDAVNLMKDLYSILKNEKYSKDDEDLSLLMVRLMYCFYADRVDIFDGKFSEYVNNTHFPNNQVINQNYEMTALTEIFNKLNTPIQERQIITPPSIVSQLKYINGGLFSKQIPTPNFNLKAAEIFRKCYVDFDWSKISPAIFGSMFQSIMDVEGGRREDGIHYTSRKDIMKVINSLFLDELKKEVEDNKHDLKYLQTILNRISKMHFFDPACGCGNFLTVIYEEIRNIEMDIYEYMHLNENHNEKVLKEIFDKGIKVENFHGIEIHEIPTKIAITSLWIKDHDMNRKLQSKYGIYYERLPLKKDTPNIIHGNALTVDWSTLIQKEKLISGEISEVYILGNPPYIGSQVQSTEQKENIKIVCSAIKKYNSLDYVSAWFVKASEFIQNTKIKVAFVSTNSITQGESVGILWKYLKEQNIFIHFAHRTFKWITKASGKNAAVHVVIIGFANYDISNKIIYDYETITSEPKKYEVKNINSYLINYEDIFITSKSKPISNVPECLFGNMPNDKGNFLFNDNEKRQFIYGEPKAVKFMKKFISADQFLNGQDRWCLWLKDIQPYEIDEMPKIKEIINKVKEHRLNSTAPATRKKANISHLFYEISQPKSGNYLLIPLTSSEKRKYIPLGFFSHEDIVSNSCSFIPNATLYHFGVLSSLMHMAWVKTVCGRLESRFRYSGSIVYNNFPWVENPSKEDVKHIEELAQDVLNIREKYKMYNTLSQLYDPIKMPPDLTKAHEKLDKAVDKLYRKESFNSDNERLEFLFEMYKNITEKSLNTIKTDK